MRWTLALLLVATSVAHASPNVSLDDPRYHELTDAFVGGFRPLTERRIRELLTEAARARARRADDAAASVDATEPMRVGTASGSRSIGDADGSTRIDMPPEPSAWWLRPLTRGLVRAIAMRDPGRPYSTTAHVRDVIGLLAESCEHTEGRPCGSGAGLLGEVDAAAGYGDWVSAAARVQAVAGTDAYEADLSIDRLYLNAEVGPIAAEVGRDVIVLGPAARTQLAWGDNAPPLDHVRLSTAKPVALTSALDGSLLWIIGRLRDPQRYPGTLVSITRGQLDLAHAVEVGITQLLQVGGDGAPALGVWDFVLEHVRRGNLSAGEADTSNRRLGLDVAARIAGGRVYYALMFEDWRDRFHDALRHDADHLIGGEAHDIVVEVQKTGVRSHEHSPRTTGFTNAGRLVGSPLGPDAMSVFASGRLVVRGTTFAPWVELARLSSDRYTFVVDGPIEHSERRVSEVRYRAGLRLRRPLRDDLRVEAEALYEHIDRFRFLKAAQRDNVGASISVIWQPAFRLR
jgi:hypothetical protein